MKKFRLLSLVLCISLLCTVLTGCVGVVNRTEINADGSGTFIFKAGYTAEGIEVLNGIAEDGQTAIDISKLQPFTYNGVTYYGEVEKTVNFTSCEDFNKKLVETINSVENMSAEEGLCTLSMLDNGSFVLKFGGAIDSSDLEQGTEGVSESMKEMMNSMVMAFEFKFPYAVTWASTEGVDGAKVNGNTVVLDLLKISQYFAEQGKSEAYIELVAKKPGTAGIVEPEIVGTEDAPSIIAPQVFDDVTYRDWFYTAVNNMAYIGMVTGVGDRKFNPNGQMTYAEFSQIVARANKIDTGEINGYWAGKAIEYARDWTYIKDLGDITPTNYDVPVSREVAVAGVYRMARNFLQDKDTSITEFDIPDYDLIDPAYRNEVLFAYQAGLSHGNDAQGTFNPKATLTRAELCQLLYNSGFVLN